MKWYTKAVLMKQRSLISLLKHNGWYLLRSGANHDIYTNGHTTEPIERHREIPEPPAQVIIKRNHLK